MDSIQFYPAGDSTVVVQFGGTIHEATSRRIARFAENLRQARVKGVGELIPTFCTLSVQYNPRVIGYQKLVKQLHRLLPHEDDGAAAAKTIHIIPVCYGGEFGKDLPFVARHAGLSEQEVIHHHTGRDYLIYMLGFLPGFCYLGGLDERIHTPRLANPRLKIRAGSVGIGGSQTGIYPLDSPGGWQLMGMTPVKTYDPDREVPILVEAGNYIRFVPVDEAEYHRIQELVDSGDYQCVIHEEV